MPESHRGGEHRHHPHHHHEHPDHHLLESPEVPIGLGSLADVFVDPDTEPERRKHHMSIGDFGLVISSVLIAACGQLLLRHGMMTIREQTNAHGVDLLKHAAMSPWVVGGLAVFGMSAMLWLVTLSKVPLSRAYPFTALGFIGILGASAVLFNEPVGPQLWLGVLIVVCGLLIVVRA
jgi:drug/metabolite transporter (DMT)-like permease